MSDAAHAIITSAQNLSVSNASDSNPDLFATHKAAAVALIPTTALKACTSSSTYNVKTPEDHVDPSCCGNTGVVRCPQRREADVDPERS